MPEGFCGSIAVEWAAETPLLIGAQEGGADSPLRLGDDYVIPGATLRGMLRASCEIVGHGRLFQVNRHHRYGVRDFNHALFKDAARPSWDNLHAAWLWRDPDFEKARLRGESGYWIKPCRKHTIRIRDLPARFRGYRETDGRFHLRWLGLELEARYSRAQQKGPNSKVIDFETPRVRFLTAEGGEDRLLPDESGTGDPVEGIFVFSNQSPTLKDIRPEILDAQDASPAKGNQKKNEYVFSDLPGAQPAMLSPEAFHRFELAHSKPSKNKREPDGSYAVLHPTLEAGRRIPVFYLGDLNQQHEAGFGIGLTRLFKRPHLRSVGDVLHDEVNHRPGNHAEFAPDMVESLFGYVFEPDELGLDAGGAVAPAAIAQKGRVAFGFAIVEAGSGPSAELISTVMMGPRASFGPFYLRGPKRDWTDGEARLAGRKRYFPRFNDPATARTAIYDTLRQYPGTDGTRSHLRFLESRETHGEIRFRGEIRLHNVSVEEIGLLLWVLTHGGNPEKPYRHMIGRAKAAGAGQVRVRSIALTLTGNDPAACGLKQPLRPWEQLDGAGNGWTNGPWSLSPFLQRFQKKMRLVNAAWPRTRPVQEWLGVSMPGLITDAGTPGASYMDLARFRLVRRDLTDTVGTTREDRLLPAPLPPVAPSFPYDGD